MKRLKKFKLNPHTVALFSISALFTLLVFSPAQKFTRLFSVQKTAIAYPKPSPSFTPTPSPSLTPTPTPAPTYTGFCLNIPVLMYHHIQPLAEAKKIGNGQLTVDVGMFDKQMHYLVSGGYNAISADQLVQALVTKRRLSPKSIVITIDDGYSDMFTYAYPVLQKYNLKASLMIPTGLIDNQGYLSWTQLKQMIDSGLVSAYDHTWSHNSLPADSTEKAQYEILTAKKQLEDHLGKSQNIFAYPYGSENNFVINLLKSDGFIAAFSIIPGITQCDSFIMTLHRTRIGNSPLSTYGI